MHLGAMKNANDSLLLELLREIRDLLRAHLEPTPSREAPAPEPPDRVWDDATYLVTTKEAMAILHASRNTVDALRREGRLTTYSRGRFVRLLRAEVEAARHWWSVPKGKI